MYGQQRDGEHNALTFNPVLALWTLPFVMSQAWLTAWSGMGAKSIVSEGHPNVPGDAAEDGQIPVPKPFQEAKDKELFA